ncbi:hypothetical protein GHT09_018836 [Marmota monax]|uniref:non-specific protein-tyrosine kinase n=1 Tax=Marmota monax TaxID=9995 RepID=A0A834UHV4_MARMO|nr:hypothetical protein GHT09_018836 [Marmota monax]
MDSLSVLTGRARAAGTPTGCMDTQALACCPWPTSLTPGPLPAGGLFLESTSVPSCSLPRDSPPKVPGSADTCMRCPGPWAAPPPSHVAAGPAGGRVRLVGLQGGARDRPAPVGAGAAGLSGDEEPCPATVPAMVSRDQVHLGPKYVGLWDFEARTDEELSFRQGDIFHVTRKEEQWWWATLLDSAGAALAEGYVPCNYLAEKEAGESEP